MTVLSPPADFPIRDALRRELSGTHDRALLSPAEALPDDAPEAP